MNVSSLLRNTLIASAVAIGLQSCGLFGGNNNGGYFDDQGELVGVQGREGWAMTMPYGMVSIPAGTFHMGQADEDVPATQINFNKQITIGPFFMDDTEVTNNEYRQFTDFLQNESEADLPDGLVIEDLIPDTSVWVNDFTYHMGDPLMIYYWSHPAFDNYPVVGVDWEAANYFCEWRTTYLNNYRSDRGEFSMPNFRLPSEAEWEYAARGGRDMARYPWGNPYIRNVKGCLLANFKPGRGNYFDDGFAYTAPVATFFPNDYGLYEMSGNVAEWCNDAFNPASYPLVWDLNPTYENERETRKVVRGGSWKDIAYYLETGTRTFEYKDTARSSVGFRCAMTHIGRSSTF